jgi:hypothetical protein
VEWRSSGKCHSPGRHSGIFLARIGRIDAV